MAARALVAAWILALGGCAVRQVNNEVLYCVGACMLYRVESQGARVIKEALEPLVPPKTPEDPDNGRQETPGGS